MIVPFAAWMTTAFLIYGMVLVIHALRTRLSLAPTYIMLGFVAAIMMWASVIGARLPLGFITVYWGSTLYTGLLLGIFVIYVFDGSTAARMAMVTACVVILGTYVAQNVFFAQVASGISQADVALPKGSPSVYFASAFAALCDLVFMSVVWEALHRSRVTRFLPLRIFVTLFGTLMLDTFLFATIAFWGTDLIGPVMRGSLIDRTILSFWITPILATYILWQRRVHGTDLGRRRVLSIVQRSAQSERELTEARQEIAVRDQVEAALREQEEQFRTLVKNIPGVTFRCLLDDDRTILFISDSVEEATGYPPEDFVQNAVRSYGSLIHPSDRILLTDTIAEAVRSRQPYSVGYRIIHRSGAIHWMGERGRVFFDDRGEPKWVDGVASDVTERRLAEDQLRESREYSSRFEFIANTVEDGMSLVSREYRLMAVNDAWLRAVDRRRDDVIGQYLFDVWGTDVFEKRIRPRLDECFDGQTVVYQEWIDFIGSGQRFCEVKLFPYRDSSESITHGVVVTRDITEEHETREALRDARNAAESANRAKSDFLATMSHEIRTPMNAIIGMTRLALKTDLTAKQRDYLDKTLASANSLLGIINDILDFSKIEAGRLEMESVVFNLDDVLTHLGNVVSVRTSERDHLEVLFDTPHDVPRMLVGDPLRLGQVLINLASNAVKFTERGEIVVKTRLIELVENGCVLRFSISDTGIGMTDEQVARLFRPFTQADGSMSRKYGGTGLGLTISKRLVELMRGSISVKSAPGQGSTFSFTARFENPDEATPIYRARVPNLSGMRVLVVDDNARSREILEGMLQSLSFRVTLCASGEEGLAAVEKGINGEPFDLILMDWKMPGIDGIETARRIQLDNRLNATPPVVLVTAYSRDDVLRAAEEAGIASVLSKPVSESALFDTIMTVIGLGGSRPQSAPESDLETEVARRLGGAHVLLAEDNEINQQVAEELLNSVGLKVTIAGNGQEAVAALDTGIFDGVLMDIQMPDLDGYGATKAIREQDRFKDLPIIAMTANAMAGDRERCIAAGMNAHVAKPIDPEELFATLLQWIPERQQDKANVTKNVKHQEDDVVLPDEDFPALSFQEGLHRLGGNRKLYLKLLRQFRDRNAESTAVIVRALDSGDRELAARTAHSIKGSAGNVGARQLHAAASQLEGSLIRGADSQGAQKFIHDFDAAMNAFLEAIAKVDAMQPADESGKVDGSNGVSPDRVMELASEIRGLLDSDYSQAMDKAQMLGKHLKGSEWANAYSVVEQSMEQFDTEGACVALDGIIEAVRSGAKEA